MASGRCGMVDDTLGVNHHMYIVLTALCGVVVVIVFVDV